jgi:hypothetical protein
MIVWASSNILIASENLPTGTLFVEQAITMIPLMSITTGTAYPSSPHIPKIKSFMLEPIVPPEPKYMLTPIKSPNAQIHTPRISFERCLFSVFLFADKKTHLFQYFTACHYFLLYSKRHFFERGYEFMTAQVV